jgi:hypothetical protein
MIAVFEIGSSAVKAPFPVSRVAGRVFGFIIIADFRLWRRFVAVLALPDHNNGYCHQQDQDIWDPFLIQAS